MKDDQENIHYRELHTVLKFSALINSSLKIETVLDNAMKFSEEFINAEASSIYEIDEDKDELFIRVARGEKKDLIKTVRMKVGEGIAGRVVQTGEPMVIQDAGKEKRFSDKYDRMSGFKTRSLLCVPLMLRGRTIGAIQVLNKKEGKNFTKEDQEILVSLSQQIAVAIENAKLYQRLEHKFELTEQELKTTQEKLIRTERLAAMGNLVNGIAHEIRNPVVSIGGFAARIKDAAVEDAGLRKYADIILSETMRLENLVRKVNEFLEVQSAEIRPADLEAVIGEAVTSFKPLAEKQGVEIQVSIEHELPEIEIDSRQIYTALANIIENGLEAMAKGGKMEILVSRKDEQSICVTIKDNGSGMDEDTLGSAYDPFVTSKTHGAGLGLTMVCQIIKNHNGDILLNSKKAEGTTVNICLPLRHNQPDTVSCAEPALH
ncbi:MAG: GAF domain-containing protein [Deltaproteobacteria bacterium]|nr:GAF domain-containing protein [Deltaproteobacteria bacterium]